MSGLDRSGLKRHTLSPIVLQDAERIHQGALHVLENTGIVIHDRDILALLQQAGCPVDQETKHARMLAPVIDAALSHAPRVVTLYNRLGEPAMALGAGPFFARTSSGATGILDLETGRRREPTCQDAAEAARLADALPHIHGVSTMASQPAEVPADTVDVHAFRIAVANTIKPLGYVCLNERLIEGVIAMAVVVAGGEENLQAHPLVTALVESTSPLQLVSSQMALLKQFARLNLPLTLHAHPMAAYTAPTTLAGELVITHAEILALVTIAQMVQPGTPVIYGISSSVPDMRSGLNLSGAVENSLLGAAAAKLAKHVGLPCVFSCGTDAHEPGDQSVLERVMTLLPPALAGIDLVNLTTLGTKMTFSLEQLVMDDLILSLVGRYVQGIQVDDETLALDLIDQVGPGGAFITATHTLRHFRRELQTPDLLNRQNREAWETAGSSDLRYHARSKARHLLAEHQAQPLADAVSAQLDQIAEAAIAGKL